MYLTLSVMVMGLLATCFSKTNTPMAYCCFNQELPFSVGVVINDTGTILLFLGFTDIVNLSSTDHTQILPLLIAVSRRYSTCHNLGLQNQLCTFFNRCCMSEVKSTVHFFLLKTWRMKHFYMRIAIKEIVTSALAGSEVNLTISSTIVYLYKENV